jgi:hypothetical protein
MDIPAVKAEVILTILNRLSWFLKSKTHITMKVCVSFGFADWVRQAGDGLKWSLSWESSIRVNVNEHAIASGTPRKILS